MEASPGAVEVHNELVLEPWRLTLKLREAHSGNVEGLRKFGSD
jgi:hypothetical protein